jgi:hypothetical protein
MNDYGPIIEEAVRLSRISGTTPETTEATLDSSDGAAITISRNDEGAFLAVTMVGSHSGTPSEALLESLLQVTSRTIFGDQLIGGCLPDRRLTLSAIIPLSQVNQTELERRVNHLFTTYRELASSAESEPVAQAAETETGSWMRI